MAIFDNLGGYDLAPSKASGALREEIDNKADIDGYYEQLTAGAADNLTGRGDGVEASYLYRTAGGEADIADGVATIKSVRGNTLVWNQLNRNSLGTHTTLDITATVGNDGSVTLDGTATSDGSLELSVINTKANHKYLIKGGPSGGSSSTYSMNIGGLGADYGNGSIISNTSDVTTRLRITLHTGNAFSNVKIWPMIFDLTAMFGSGNEPSTVAEFEALFPLPYYPYDAGSLLSVNMEGVETVGFNQLNPTKVSALNGVTTSGDVYSGTSASIRGAMVSGWEGIDFLPGMQYEMSFKVETGTASGVNARPNIFYTDGTTSDGTAAGSDGIAYAISTEGKTVDHFSLNYSNNGTLVFSQPCIHLVWSGYRNGEYEEYWLQQRLIDAATYFPNGMRSAGTAYDELTADAAITRIGERAYQSGDESDPTVITDGTVTHYPLTTPTTTPINPPLNLSYKVSDFGTERILVDTTGEMSAPPTMQVVYGLNAVDTIRRLPEQYISKESFEQYLLARDAHDGTTTTMTWDSTDNRYEFTINDNESEG